MKNQKQIKWSDAAKSLEQKTKESNFDILSDREALLDHEESNVVVCERLRQICNKKTKQEKEQDLKTGLDIINSSKKKIRYCYLVYCNKDPIVYSVYSSAQEAIKYAEYLIKYRQEFNTKNGLIVDFYHKYYNTGKDSYGDEMEKTIFSACLSIKDKNGNRDDKSYSDDGCWVKVVRKSIRYKFGE